MYFSVMLAYCSINKPMPGGEWDDYSLPVASILYEHNFSITQNDVECYKALFPEWAEHIQYFSLSGRFTRNGGEMPWYFPVYAIICIPFVLILKVMRLPTIYSFAYTNLMVFLVALLFVYKCLKTEERKKCLLIAALSIHPVIFYFGWISAEVFIYSCLIIAMVSWYNRWYKRSAVAVSVAGMLNPTIMSVGIVMIIWYLYAIFQNRDTDFISCLKDNLKDIMTYGCCYIIGLIPMVYNYYNTGYINLSASYETYLIAEESVWERFLSYLFDLNYGILPYHFFLLLISIALVAAAFVRRHGRYLVWMLAFVVNIILYSYMIHINSGMSGTARYNTWVSAIFIFAVCLFMEEILKKRRLIQTAYTLAAAGICFTGLVVFRYGLYCASDTNYTYMTPVAEFILDKFPDLYNPLHSTFNSRTNHVDGGYYYETPIVYFAEDGYVRKILASEKDKDELLKNFESQTGYNDWLADEIYSLTQKDSYISIPAKYQVYEKFSETNNFSKQEDPASNYIRHELSGVEKWGTGSDGYNFEAALKCMAGNDTLKKEVISNVHHDFQNIRICINDMKDMEQEKFKDG